MDARKFTSKFVNPDAVREGPITAQIIAVLEDERYSRLLLELETGSQFGLNDTNTRALIKAFGHDTEAWLGKEIVLELGTYKDWKTDPPEDKETVKVRAVSPTKTASGNSGAPSKLPPPVDRTSTSLRDDLADDVPFILAFLIANAAWFIAGSGALIA